MHSRRFFAHWSHGALLSHCEGHDEPCPSTTSNILTFTLRDLLGFSIQFVRLRCRGYAPTCTDRMLGGSVHDSRFFLRSHRHCQLRLENALTRSCRPWCHRGHGGEGLGRGPPKEAPRRSPVFVAMDNVKNRRCLLRFRVKYQWESRTSTPYLAGGLLPFRWGQLALNSESPRKAPSVR